MKGYRTSQKSPAMGGRSNSGSQRSKPVSKVAVGFPIPVNLPSRKLESAGAGAQDSSLFGSPGSSWASPSTSHAVAHVAGSSSSTSPSSPAMVDGTSPVVSAAAHLTSISAATTGGAESPLSDSNNHNGGSASSTPKPAPPRAWAVVASTTEKSLAEFPTAAEASKMAVPDTHADGGSHYTSEGANNAMKRPSDEANRSLSSISVENKWDEIDDENEDFLFAEKIEFADGAVNVQEVVNLVARSEVSKPQQQDTAAHISASLSPKHGEERIVERSEDDYDRQWPPQRHHGGPGSHALDSTTRYHPLHGSTNDRPRQQQLWQGGLPASARDVDQRRPSRDHDRRPSADHHYHGLPPGGVGFGGGTSPSSGGGGREPFGQRGSDLYRGSGPLRRDSTGGRVASDTLGPPSRSSSRDFGGGRRDSFDHHPHRGRGGDYDHSRGRNYSRDHEYGRGGRSDDFSQDRRGSYDRDRDRRGSRDPSSQRYDLHVLSRSRDSVAAGGNDRSHDVGYHDGSLGSGSGRLAPDHSDHGASFGRQHPYSNVPPPPPGVSEWDRPEEVTQDQIKTMKHAAEDARRRREEDERQREEAKARAKAKADEIARVMEKQKKEKEEADARTKREEDERVKREIEDKAKLEAEQAKAKTIPAIPTTSTATDKDKERNNNQNNSKSRAPAGAERAKEDDAIAQWVALPEKLMKEGKERAEQIRAERRREEDERQRVATATSGTTANAWTSGQQSWRRPDTSTGEGTSAPVAGTVVRGTGVPTVTSVSPKQDSASSSRQTLSSGNEPKEPTVGQIDSVMKNIKEHFDARGTTLEEMEASIKKTALLQESTSTITLNVADTAVAVPEEVTEAASSTSSATLTTGDNKGVVSSETDLQVMDKGLSARERLKLRGSRTGAERVANGASTTATATPVALTRADNAQTWRREMPLPATKPTVSTAPSTETKVADTSASINGESTTPAVQESETVNIDAVVKRPKVEPTAVTTSDIGKIIDTGAAGSPPLAVVPKGGQPNGTHAGDKATTPVVAADGSPVRPVPVKRHEPKDYPAKTIDSSLHATISDITALFARIANLPAGESPTYNSTKAATPQKTDIPGNVAASKTQQVSGDDTTTLATAGDTATTGKDHHLKAAGHVNKRHSLSNMSASIVFPSNVEQAVNRGRMSFMVASEIDDDGDGVNKGKEETSTNNWTDVASNDIVNQQETEAPRGGVAHQDNHIVKSVASVPVSLPASVTIHHPAGMYGIQQAISGDAAVAMNPQYPWGGSVESSQAAVGSLPGTAAGVMMTPTGTMGHAMQPFQHVVPPYYTYVHPYFFQYGPRGPMHPSLAQYSAAATMVSGSGGQQGRIVIDSTTAAVMASATAAQSSVGQHNSITSVSGVSSSDGHVASSPATVTANLGGSSTPSIKTSSSSGTGAGGTATTATSAANETHPWLPRFSAAGDAPSATTAASAALAAATAHQFAAAAGAHMAASHHQRGGLSARSLNTHFHHPSGYHQAMQDALGSSASPNSPVTPTGSSGGYQSLGEDDGWGATASSATLGVHSAATTVAVQHGWGLPAGVVAGRIHVGGNSNSGVAGAAVLGGGAPAMTPGFVVPGQDGFHPSQMQLHPSMHGRSRGGGGHHFGRGGYSGSHHHHQHQQHHDKNQSVHYAQQQAMGSNLINPMSGSGAGAGDRSQRSFGNSTTAPHHHGQTHFHGGGQHHHGPPGATPQSHHSRRMNSGAPAGGASGSGSDAPATGASPASGGSTSAANPSSSYGKFSARSAASATTPGSTGNSTGSF